MCACVCGYVCLSVLNLDVTFQLLRPDRLDRSPSPPRPPPAPTRTNGVPPTYPELRPSAGWHAVWPPLRNSSAKRCTPRLLPWQQACLARPCIHRRCRWWRGDMGRVVVCLAKLCRKGACPPSAPPQPPRCPVRATHHQCRQPSTRQQQPPPRQAAPADPSMHLPVRRCPYLLLFTSLLSSHRLCRHMTLCTAPLRSSLTWCVVRTSVGGSIMPLWSICWMHVRVLLPKVREGDGGMLCGLCV